MDEAQQRALAAWAVVVVPFVVLSAFLRSRGALGWEFAAAYAVGPLSLWLLGVLPVPGRSLGA
ncbi:hypothetical protein JCM30237_28110 [Halolamina litorea]|uniref:Uncharacterized protein n=1 Tax=Halolamina litorea TaxID=1515593 RepID=A0ABD6BUI4_9EURY|nr:hypothetical protein [Halolamina litorea]